MFSRRDMPMRSAYGPWVPPPFRSTFLARRLKIIGLLATLYMAQNALAQANTFPSSVDGAVQKSTDIPSDSTHRWDTSALPAVSVKAVRETTLDRTTSTGSNLGLSIFETPASIERIDQQTLRTRGDENITDAVSRAAGFSESPHPGNGGSELAARGFIGSSSVTQLFDGVKPYGAIGVTYPFDTWSVDYIDVLRGPASVIYGEGAIGGIVNIVPKKPTQGPIENEIRLGVGTEKTARVAFGSGGAINDKLSYRLDVSGNRSDNWVDRGNSKDLSFSAAVRYDITPTLDVTASYAQGYQHPMRYFGIPLVNGTLDRSLYNKNYNVADSVISYRDSWATLAAQWRPSDALRISSTFYRMKSNRHWRDVEDYSYVPSSGQIARGDYTEIFHDQEQIGNTTSATLTHDIGGLKNRVAVGFDINHTTFQHDNNSPYSGTSTVDAYDFDPGLFINIPGTKPKYRSQSNAFALFAEDRLDLTSRWSVIGGVRYDHASINRIDLVNGGGFSKVVANTGWRVGSVFDLTENTALYAQYAEAADPVSSLLMLNATSAQYKLGTGKQIEVGIKQIFLDGRAEATLAAYRIVKNNLVSPDPANPDNSIQIGQQSSRGVEATVGADITRNLHVDANVSLLRAKYDDYAANINGALVSQAGNVPAGVPQRLGNLWLRYRFKPAWTAIAGLKFAGKRYADSANQYSMPSYTTVDLGLAWQARRDTTITLRGYNILNRRYVQSAYYNETQYLLGNDRRFELLLDYRF
ncbi:TonB-dependent receptor [Robbsia andropogonis]|uniref:TonB-dependent receptor n=1 Tax=Robbsia andropogonis TaxID=28092 RepID=UPI000AA3DF6F|nr:TonB-dependent receptor [Robbsia andropogonis]